MADPDTFAGAEHADAAGWVLGVLDPEESDRFETHLESCPECQQTVAEFGSAAQMLKSVLPGVQLAEGPEPPPDLQVRTLAKVAEAASKSRHNGRWRGWSTRMLALAASVIVIVAAAGTTIGLLLSGGTAAQTYALAMHPGRGFSASGSGTIRQVGRNWSLQLTADHLPEPGSGHFYQCWWFGAGNRPGHPSRVSAGTFTVGPSGTASVQMSTAANPDEFPEVEITLDSATQPGQPGQVVLSGTVDDDH